MLISEFVLEQSIHCMSKNAANTQLCAMKFFLCLLLFAGGWVGAEIGNTIERFDPEENSWDVVGSMAKPRYCFGCCEMQGECC